jgi:hypothetical protein
MLVAFGTRETRQSAQIIRNNKYTMYIIKRKTPLECNTGHRVRSRALPRWKEPTKPRVQGARRHAQEDCEEGSVVRIGRRKTECTRAGAADSPTQKKNSGGFRDQQDRLEIVE